jgi:hypothetical protein
MWLRFRLWVGVDGQQATKRNVPISRQGHFLTASSICVYRIGVGGGSLIIFISKRMSTIMNDEKVTLSSDVRMYGVWIPNEGWLRGKDLFADTDFQKAEQVAYLIGRGARVYFIDKSIVDFEERYKANERLSKWHIFKNFFNRKFSK